MSTAMHTSNVADPRRRREGESSHDDVSQRPSFSDVRKDVSDVRRDVSQLGSDVAVLARDTAQTSASAVKSGVTQAVEAGKKAGEAVKEGHSRMCAYVSAHPTASVLIAAGIGALIARVAMSRR